MTKKSKEEAATSARRKSGARGLGVLEEKLDREKKGRVPGSDLGTKRGVRAAAHKDIRTTTAEEKREAAILTGIAVGQTLGGMWGPRHIALSKKASDKTDDLVAAVVSKAKKVLGKTKQVAAKEGKESFQKRHNLPPMSDKAAKTIQGAAFGTIAGVSGKRVYDAKKKKTTKKPPEMAKGGYVKKYAKGGGVRKAR